MSLSGAGLEPTTSDHHHPLRDRWWRQGLKGFRPAFVLDTGKECIRPGWLLPPEGTCLIGQIDEGGRPVAWGWPCGRGQRCEMWTVSFVEGKGLLMKNVFSVLICVLRNNNVNKVFKMAEILLKSCKCSDTIPYSLGVWSCGYGPNNNYNTLPSWGIRILDHKNANSANTFILQVTAVPCPFSSPYLSLKNPDVSFLCPLKLSELCHKMYSKKGGLS